MPPLMTSRSRILTPGVMLGTIMKNSKFHSGNRFQTLAVALACGLILSTNLESETLLNVNFAAYCLVHRFIKLCTHQTTSRSNCFQRWTTGAALISAIPNRILSLSSTLDLTRMCLRKVCAILPKSVSTKLSQEPCLGV